MLSIVTRNTFQRALLPLLLAFFCAPCMAAKAPVRESSGFRFGDWTLVLPGLVTKAQLVEGTVELGAKGAPVEMLLYWQDGRERALALRFSETGPREDVAVLRSQAVVERLRGCTASYSASLPPLAAVLAADAARPELPDDTVIRIDGSERSLRRVGEELVADLSPYRVKVAPDTLLVRVGEPGSGEFCRWELQDEEP